MFFPPVFGMLFVVILLSFSTNHAIIETAVKTNGWFRPGNFLHHRQENSVLFSNFALIWKIEQFVLPAPSILRFHGGKHDFG
jgi:hypothetical protein